MTNTNSVQNVINEVLATRGATVSVFGQPHKIGESVDKGYVDIIEILEGFKGYEAETVLPAQYEIVEAMYSDDPEHNYDIIDSNDNSIVIESGFEDESEAEERMYELQEENAAAASVDEFIEYMEELGYLEEERGDNSYNWAGNVSNHFNIQPYKNIETGEYLVEFKVHLYGDVRGNYTDSVLLKFDNDYAFHEMLLEHDGYEEYKGYEIRFSALREDYEIINSETYEDMDTQYAWEDALEYIDGLVSEEIGEEV
jgi:hypothetical protein